MQSFVFNTYADAVDALVADLGKRRVDLSVPHIVLVPDRYTLFMEKRLYEDGGALDLHVLTLSRLQQRVAPVQVFSRAGGVMLMRRIIDGQNEKLTYFKGAHKYPGFSQKMYDTICALKDSLVNSDGLMCAQTAVKKKLDDISLIYREYEQMSGHQFNDYASRLQMLIESADSSAFIKGAVFYAVNFADNSPLVQKALDAVAKNARAYYCYDALGASADYVPPCEVVTAPDRICEIKSAAAHIRDYVFNGGRYDDVAVLVNDAQAAVKRIFDEYEIPFYMDTRVNLFEHCLCDFIYTLYCIKTQGLKRALIIKLSKNYFCGLSGEEADAFEDYILTRALNFNDFTICFDESSVENSRHRIIDVVKKFTANRDFAAAVKNVLSVCEKAAQEFNQSSRYPVGAHAKLCSILDLMQSAYPCGDYSLCAGMFFDAAKSIEISVLPNLSNTVQVCQPEGLRGRRTKLLVILGGNEGVMPKAVINSELLLSADDLAESTIELCAAPEKQNRRARLDLKEAIDCAQNVYISYTVSQKPSVELSGYMAVAAKTADYSDRILAMKRQKTAGIISRFCSCRANTLELLALGEGFAWESAAREALGGQDALLAVLPPPENLDAAAPIKNNNISCTQLQRYFECPYKHFLCYALNLKPRPSPELSSISFGEIVHGVMRDFIERGDCDCSKETIRALVDKNTAAFPYLQKEEYRGDRERLYHEAGEICSVAAFQLNAGEFKPLYLEADFGQDCAIPPVILKNSAVRLYGKIDRADVLDRYVRVIDYKTGSTEFSVPRIYYGRSLQLPLYSAAMEQAGYKSAGMFYLTYSPGIQNEDSTRLSGVYLKDVDIVLAMDKTLADNSRSAVINCTLGCKEGLYQFGTRNASAYTQEEYSALINYALRVADNAAIEIKQGYIAQKPCRDGDYDVCRYCDFFGFCHEPHFRVMQKTDKEALVEGGGDGE